MANDRKVETGRDRRALARDAGMGKVSILSVVAGALSGWAAFEVLAVVAGAAAVAVRGTTDVSSLSVATLKTLVGAMVAAALFLSFLLSGYVAGRMSRRSGAAHGLVAGILGAVLGAAAVAAIRATGTDAGLARVAVHVHAPAIWADWRTFALAGAVVAGAAIVVGSLAGGVLGERWHGKLLARSIDPDYGPEAEQRALARKKLREAEIARLEAAEHMSRVNAGSGAVDPTRATTATYPAVHVRPVAATGAGRGRAMDRATDDDTAAAARDLKADDDTRADSDADSDANANAGEHRRRHHLLSR